MEKTKLTTLFVLILTFAFSSSAQTKPKDSILFFREKLRQLKLLVSTREDVKKALGKDCYLGCFDKKKQLLIDVDYVEEVRYAQDATTQQKLVFRPSSSQYIGKLLSVNIIKYPAEVLPDSFITAEELKCVKTVTYEAEAKETKTQICIDNQGLTYFAFEESTNKDKSYELIFNHIHFMLPTEKYLEALVLDKPDQ